TDNLEIIFGTFNTTRKYKNIQIDSSVALVIGWEEGKTVQYEGVARELAVDEIQLVRDNYWTKNPGAKKYYTDKRQRYFIVTPHWMRYTDITTEPRDIIEFQLK
ncbi:MAG TPA: pyridoxamine 5'-phosphate oxidase family protein, partial [Candidatus Saccharimonadales bacterium]|nr:pyridoxamine 5'-phosphate oxidase family protein [Candidatus Saccharimonadales bacterium]